MSRSWLLYLDDLIARAQKIERLTAARTAAEFAADEAVFDAVLFNLQVIGEAVKKLPNEDACRPVRGASIGSGPACATSSPVGTSRSTPTSCGKWRGVRCRRFALKRSRCARRSTTPTAAIRPHEARGPQRATTRTISSTLFE